MKASVTLTLLLFFILQQDSNARSLPSDTIILTGTVVDMIGKPISDVKVIWKKDTIASTDINGKFIAFVSDLKPASTISFSYTGMFRVVRNYNPAMGNTDYKVTLSPKSGIWKTDWPKKEKDVINRLNLKLHLSTEKLGDDTKSLLDSLATIIRQYGYVCIEIVGSGKSSKELKKIKEILQALRNYLIDHEGIFSESVKTRIVDFNPSFEKNIQFRDCEKEY